MYVWGKWYYWDTFCEWIGYEPDRRIYATPDDVQ